MPGASKRRRTWDGRARKRARMSSTITRTVRGRPEHRIVRKWLVGTWIWGTAAGPTGFWRAYNPTFGDMPGTERNEIIGMYDLYKINRVTIELVPRYTQFDAGGSTTNPCPVVSYYTDTTTLPSAPSGAYGASTYERFAARANGTFTTRLGNDVIKTSYRPRIQTTDGESKPFPWTTVLRADIPCNAAQIFIHGVNFSELAATSQYDIFFTFDMSLKGLR